MYLLIILVFFSLIQTCQAVWPLLLYGSLYLGTKLSEYIKNKTKEEEVIDNRTEIAIYREQFEIGYTSTIKRILNYLLHLSHDELLVSLTVILTIISMIVLYYIYRSFKYCCCKKSNKVIYKKIYEPKQLNNRYR